MVQIRLEAKTYTITDEGKWLKVWDEREPLKPELKPEELEQVGGGRGVGRPITTNPWVVNE